MKVEVLYWPKKLRGDFDPYNKVEGPNWLFFLVKSCSTAARDLE